MIKRVVCYCRSSLLLICLENLWITMAQTSWVWKDVRHTPDSACFAFDLYLASLPPLAIFADDPRVTWWRLILCLNLWWKLSTVHFHFFTSYNLTNTWTIFVDEYWFGSSAQEHLKLEQTHVFGTSTRGKVFLEVSVISSERREQRAFALRGVWICTWYCHISHYSAFMGCDGRHFWGKLAYCPFYALTR